MFYTLSRYYVLNVVIAKGWVHWRLPCYVIWNQKYVLVPL
jgi:hypothetical protein